MNFLFAFLLSVISLFLILLVLVQRGRGGGLTGALGGMGGQSAFGTKAGDTFTRVTIIAATVWILCAILSVKLLGGKTGPLGDPNAAPPPVQLPSGGGAGAGAGLGGGLSGSPLDSIPATGSTAPADGGATAGEGDAGTATPSAEANPGDSAE